MEKNERKTRRYEYFMMIGFCMIVFFAGAMDSECIAIPAAGVGIGAITAAVATWLYYHR